MSKPFSEYHLAAIEHVVMSHPYGISVDAIASDLNTQMPRRTLQYRLKHLVDNARIAANGQGRGTKYTPLQNAASKRSGVQEPVDDIIPLSTNGRAIQKQVARKLIARTPVGYDHTFLDSYTPNKTRYLTEQDRTYLHSIGAPAIGDQPAGTVAAKILDRLLIDLSWNSSRLEGNIYSLLDTQRLLVFDHEADVSNALETQMILNHKDAIRFLVDSAIDIGFNRYTLLNLHGLLSYNLMPDPTAEGRLRQFAANIRQSVYRPLDVPQLISEHFDQVMATAEAINDPFEQSFFAMVHLPYLQPFEDVNKPVSRLSANIPLIKHNLLPLAFTDVPTALYTAAMLGIYELKQIDLLKDVYFWAYRRSTNRYRAVRQIIGEPNPFVLRYRDELFTVIQQIIKNSMDRQATFHHISDWTTQHITTPDQHQFMTTTEEQIMALHEGNFARYRVTALQFSKWRDTWSSL